MVKKFDQATSAASVSMAGRYAVVRRILSAVSSVCRALLGDMNICVRSMVQLFVYSVE